MNNEINITSSRKTRNRLMANSAPQDWQYQIYRFPLAVLRSVGKAHVPQLQQLTRPKRTRHMRSNRLVFFPLLMSS